MHVFYHHFFFFKESRHNPFKSLLVSHFLIPLSQSTLTGLDSRGSKWVLPFNGRSWVPMAYTPWAGELWGLSFQTTNHRDMISWKGKGPGQSSEEYDLCRMVGFQWREMGWSERQWGTQVELKKQPRKEMSLGIPEKEQHQCTDTKGWYQGMRSKAERREGRKTANLSRFSTSA